jgi:hypothetical protein
MVSALTGFHPYAAVGRAAGYGAPPRGGASFLFTQSRPSSVSRQAGTHAEDGARPSGAQEKNSKVVLNFFLAAYRLAVMRRTCRDEGRQQCPRFARFDHASAGSNKGHDEERERRQGHGKIVLDVPRKSRQDRESCGVIRHREAKPQPCRCPPTRNRPNLKP